MIINKDLYPIIDLHCDLLHYLINNRNANPFSKIDIGCAIPYLMEGNVKIQVMAIYSETKNKSSTELLKQFDRYQRLLSEYDNRLIQILEKEDLKKVLNSSKVGLILSIENATGLCAENENIKKAFERLNIINNKFRKILYISLTHSRENRFGGGNATNIGIKDDGKALLKYIDGKKIAIDLSHCSDALAHDILNYIDKKSLNVPVMASHSNFRSVFKHTRNLPDELAKQIFKRNGIIGINFLRAFVHNNKPYMLLKHIKYGFELGGEKSLCFGADYFCTKDHPDQSRIPFFFEEHKNALCYQAILNSLEKFLSSEEIKSLAYKNALDFFRRTCIDL